LGDVANNEGAWGAGLDDDHIVGGGRNHPVVQGNVANNAALDDDIPPPNAFRGDDNEDDDHFANNNKNDKETNVKQQCMSLLLAVLAILAFVFSFSIVEESKDQIYIYTTKRFLTGDRSSSFEMSPTDQYSEEEPICMLGDDLVEGKLNISVAEVNMKTERTDPNKFFDKMVRTDRCLKDEPICMLGDDVVVSGEDRADPNKSFDDMFRTNKCSKDKPICMMGDVVVQGKLNISIAEVDVTTEIVVVEGNASLAEKKVQREQFHKSEKVHDEECPCDGTVNKSWLFVIAAAAALYIQKKRKRDREREQARQRIVDAGRDFDQFAQRFIDRALDRQREQASQRIVDAGRDFDQFAQRFIDRALDRQREQARQRIVEAGRDYDQFAQRFIDIRFQAHEARRRTDQNFRNLFQFLDQQRNRSNLDAANDVDDGLLA
jgi:hypothetical protein